MNKNIEWDEEKNQKLLCERGIGFEEIVVAIQNGHLVSVVKSKSSKYTHQHIFVVLVEGYTYAVPFVEDEKKIFLKTIFPSRILHKKYYRSTKDE